MSFLRRLFGGAFIRKIPGVIFSVQSSSLHNQDIQSVPPLIELLAALTAKHDAPHFVEVTFDGFDQDPRPVDEIPEVAAWARQVQERYPEWHAWLTPGTLLRHAMCTIPDLAERLPNGQVALNLGVQGFRDLLSEGVDDAANRLRRLGMSDAKIREAFHPAITQNRQAMILGQNLLGKHYIVTQ